MLKTTRVCSLSGEQIIFSNADLLKSQIRNYQRMSERRVVFKLKVDSATELSVLKTIPPKIKAIVSAQPKTRFDRAHLKETGD